MKEIISLGLSCFKDESGSAAIEYGLVAGLIATLMIAGLMAITVNMNRNFNTLSNHVTIK